MTRRFTTLRPPALAGIAAAVATLLWPACATSETAGEHGDAPQPVRPAWLTQAGSAADARLDHAARALCARNTDGVIDAAFRREQGIWEGSVFGLVRTGPGAQDALNALEKEARPLLAAEAPTHTGYAQPSGPGTACVALVGVRRLVRVDGVLPLSVKEPGSFTFPVALPPGVHATLFVQKPDGFVLRVQLPGDHGGPPRAMLPAAGRYTAELVVQRDAGPPDPQVALLWPFAVEGDTRGAPPVPPVPAVLFPDAGHDDTALSHRAEALVQRLRNAQLIDTLKVAPVLVDLGHQRARAVSARGTLGHRTAGDAPAGDAAPAATADVREQLDALAASQPRARFVRVAELQARASTLQEAWDALLQSPAHRAELVEQAYTHQGTSVVRGVDPAGRPTITLVILLARRPPERALDTVRTEVLTQANALRDKTGFGPLGESRHLQGLAQRLAERMRDAGSVDNTLLGGPIADVALEADASLERVTPFVGRLPDPLLLLSGAPLELLLPIDVKSMAVGMALSATDGMFYCVLLAAE